MLKNFQIDIVGPLTPPHLNELVGLHKEFQDMALVFCCLMEKIDGTSDPNDVAKVEAMIEAAVATFEETPVA
jgi:hypothetical protein